MLGLQQGESKTPPYQYEPPQLIYEENPPYLAVRSLNWNNLSVYDQIIFCLQQGAPVEKNVLPLKWNEVKRALAKRQYLSSDLEDSALETTRTTAS